MRLLMVALATASMVLVPALPGQAVGNTYTVDSTADASDATPGDGVCDDGAGNCTLRAAVEEANASDTRDTIVLTAGTYTLTLGQLGITEDVVIQGAGAGSTTIDADGNSRVIMVTGATSVGISGVTITGGSVAGTGAGINLGSGGSVLSLIDVAVSGNAATSSGGGIYANSNSVVTIVDSSIDGNTAGGSGGGIYFSEAVATLRMVTIDDNASSSSGGGFYSDSGNISAWDTHITNNSASSGGGFYNFYARLFLSGGSVSGNEASGTGGGAYDYESKAEYVNVPFTGNTASSAGGAYVEYGLSVWRDSEISGNTASGSGGGVYAEDGGNAELFRTPLVNNQVTTALGTVYGGGAYIEDGGRLLLEDSPATGNVATTESGSGYGGGIYVYSAQLEVRGNSPIDDNALDVTSSGYGGGIYAYETGIFLDDVSASRNSITTTSSAYGGAIYAEYASVRLHGVTMADNLLDTGSTAEGGGVWVYYGGVTILDSALTGNVAGTGGSSGYGGAVNCDDYAGIEIGRSLIDGNSATYVGGGVAWYECGIHIYDSTISNNTALNPDSPGDATYGGGLASDDYGGLLLERSVVSGNLATYMGGGIYLYDAPATIRDSMVVDNTVDDQEDSDPAYGGGIATDCCSPLTLERSVVMGNTAIADDSAYGGGIYMNGDEAIVLVDSEVSGNTVETRDTTGTYSSYGGGVYLDGAVPLYATRSLFAGNDAVAGTGSDAYGGGIYNDGTAAVLVNSTLSGNSAGTEGGAAYSNFGSFRFHNVTGVANEAGPASGGFVYNSGGKVVLGHTLLQDNSPDACAGDPANSHGWNIVDDASCGVSETGDQESTSAAYDPLADNGGWTMTHALPTGSAAIDAGAATCYDATGVIELTSDQRGANRPVDGTGDGTVACDVGAYEVQIAVTVVATVPTATKAMLEPGQFTFTRPGTSGDLEVSYSIGGTAVADEDYEEITGTVTILDGQMSATVDVVPLENFGTGDTTVVVTILQSTTYEVGAPSAATVTIEDVTPGVSRLAGDDRMDTAIATSQDLFADVGAPGRQAGAVVLSRSDNFPDALGGTPLAVKNNAPLLLTRSPEANVAAGLAESVDPRTLAEIQRVLAPGGTVYILGGPVAISTTVEAQIVAAGFSVVRLGGADRYETAVLVANATTTTPSAILITTGLNFPDALAAGAAASAIDGVVVLSRGEDRAAATDTYLAGVAANVPRYGVGGPSARAYGASVPIIGNDRFETATMVADTFFEDPQFVGVGRSDLFPDSLSGGVHIGHRGGPLVLTAPSGLDVGLGGQANTATRSYLEANAASILVAYLYGGEVAIHSGTATQIANAID